MRGAAPDGKKPAGAAEWIEQDGDMYLFSFDSVCDTLGIDPDALREAIKSRRAPDRRVASRFSVVRRRTKVRAYGVYARRRVATSERFATLTTVEGS